MWFCKHDWIHGVCAKCFTHKEPCLRIPLTHPDETTNRQELAMEGFTTKDSGERQTFETGMQRDTQTNKARYDLIWLPGIKRVAELMARGALKYNERNWEKASTQEEMNRFDASLLRHTYQLLEGDRSEDHMAAIIFNAFGREMVREKLSAFGKIG